MCCDEFQLKPSAFYRWQKEFLENGAAAFERDGNAAFQRLQAQVLGLRAKPTRKDQVIAELLEAHLALKGELDQS